MKMIKALRSFIFYILFSLSLLIFTNPVYLFAKDFYVFNVMQLREFLGEAMTNQQDDTIYLAPGIYEVTSEPLIYWPECASEGAPVENYSITIVGSGSGSTILEGKSNTEVLVLGTCFRHWAPVRCKDGNSHITIKKITFRNAYKGVFASSVFSNITIEDCEFLNINHEGAYLASTEGDINIRNSLFMASNWGGLLASSNNGKVNLINNSFKNMNLLSPQSYAAEVTSYHEIEIKSNVFEENQGGIFISTTGKLNFINNSINFNNETQSKIVKIEANQGFLNIYGNRFTNNNGSGLVLEVFNSTVNITNNKFHNNMGYLGIYGGGIYSQSFGGNIIFHTNIFKNNSADCGGGVYSYTDQGAITFINNIFSKNEFRTEGGGIYLKTDRGKIILTNNTIVDNLWKGNPPSYAAGGGIYLNLLEAEASAELYNNIIWGNRILGNEAPAYGSDIYIDNPEKAIVNLFNNNYNDLSIVKGDRLYHSLNINKDPLLDFSFHLTQNSPCIDVGNNGAPFIPNKDFEDEARIMDGNGDGVAKIDIGADEYSSKQIFSDVPPGYWAGHYIFGIYNAQITTGYGDGRYGPEDFVTREQMAAFIVRAVEGEPPLNYCDSGSPFSDVLSNSWSCRYIKRLKEFGITTGYGDGRYGPEDFVTRAQMAAFIIRAFAGEPLINYCDSGSLFTDVPPDRWSCRYIKRLKEFGITTGYGDGRYGPEDFVTRAQMAAFLSRAFLSIE